MVRVLLLWLLLYSIWHRWQHQSRLLRHVWNRWRHWFIWRRADFTGRTVVVGTIVGVVWLPESLYARVHWQIVSVVSYLRRSDVATEMWQRCRAIVKKRRIGARPLVPLGSMRCGSHGCPRTLGVSPTSTSAHGSPRRAPSSFWPRRVPALPRCVSVYDPLPGPTSLQHPGVQNLPVWPMASVTREIRTSVIIQHVRIRASLWTSRTRWSVVPVQHPVVRPPAALGASQWRLRRLIITTCIILLRIVSTMNTSWRRLQRDVLRRGGSCRDAVPWEDDAVFVDGVVRRRWFVRGKLGARQGVSVLPRLLVLVSPQGLSVCHRNRNPWNRSNNLRVNIFVRKCAS